MPHATPIGIISSMFQALKGRNMSTMGNAHRNVRNTPTMGNAHRNVRNMSTMGNAHRNVRNISAMGTAHRKQRPCPMQHPSELRANEAQRDVQGHCHTRPFPSKKLTSPRSFFRIKKKI